MSPQESPRHCFKMQHEGSWIFVPMCMGAAVLGQDNCTCESMEDRIIDMELTVRQLREEMEKLRASNQGLFLTTRVLWAAVRKLASPEQVNMVRDRVAKKKWLWRVKAGVIYG